MPSLDQIRESIEVRLSECRLELAALQAGRAALESKAVPRTKSASSTKTVVPKPRSRRAAQATSNGHSSAGATKGGNGAAADTPAPAPAPAEKPAAKAPGDSATSRRRARSAPARPQKSVEVLLSGKLEAMLGQADDGLSAISLARRANAGYNQVRDLLRDLESAGQVRRTGSRQTSLWRLITDEDRVAERVAELELLSRTKS
jgi:hypothetical protein